MFPPYTGAGLAGVQVGAMIEVAAPALHPGTATEVRLSFWASEARAIAVSGARFRLWHGHTVGSGTVLVGADPGDGARP